MSISIDDGGSCAHALEPDWLPHHDEFMVGARVHHNQIAGIGCVNGCLDRRIARWYASRSLATNGHGDSVDRRLAVCRLDEQLTAACRRVWCTVLRLLLNRALRDVRGNRTRDRGVVPGYVAQWLTSYGNVGAHCR